MKLAACILLAFCFAQASGPISVYARIDKVTIEPNSEKVEIVRISGVFITAEERTDHYSEPQKGYLCLTIPGDNADLVRRELSDLKSVAGTRQIVGFGSSWYGSVRVRKADDDAKSPDRYPLGNGLVKVNADQPRAKALLEYQEH